MISAPYTRFDYNSNELRRNDSNLGYFDGVLVAVNRHNRGHLTNTVVEVALESGFTVIDQPDDDILASLNSAGLKDLDSYSAMVLLQK